MLRTWEIVGLAGGIHGARCTPAQVVATAFVGRCLLRVIRIPRLVLRWGRKCAPQSRMDSHPDGQRKAQKGIDHVGGIARLRDFGDRLNLPCVEAV